MPKLLVATYNPGKLAELQGLLADLQFDLVDLNNCAGILEVAETGITFDENARLKASGYAKQAGLPAIADDSGLEVDVLGGRPGVLSARYGGPNIGFDEKMSMLLAEIGATGSPDRQARFACSIAVADPSGKILHTTRGVCEGTIAVAPRGRHGFGYDPLFIPHGYEMTFGELSGEIKRKISHRANAFQQIMPFLRHFSSVLT